jgi:hypothetical protein
MKQDCPVCGVPMTGDYDTMEHVIMEEWLQCPNDCYRYEFLTGYSCVWLLCAIAPLSHAEFVYGWTTPADERKRTEQAIRRAIAALKEGNFEEVTKQERNQDWYQLELAHS